MAIGTRRAGDVRIRILGPLEVQADQGEPAKLGGRQQRAVLAMLALQANVVVPIDDLITGIWGERPPDRAANTLQVYISRFRRLGGGQELPVHRRGAGYMLEANSDSLDLARFRELVLAATRTESMPAREGERLLRQALDLWRGPALREFAGLPFAAAPAAALDQELLAARTARLSTALDLGLSTEIVAELETLTATHPLNEELHAQLTLALYNSGRQADALSVLRRIRRRLADDLGVDPGPHLRDLEQAVLSQHRDVVAPATPVRRTTIWNVPARNPHFSGRTALLDRVFARLSAQPDSVAAQTLYGLGGVGKTQLAIEFAHRFASAYSLVWWFNAGEPSFIPAQFARLNQQLGLPARASADDVVEQVLVTLSDTADWLMIFDNAGRVDEVAPYRPFGAGHLLVTSRTPLWGEIGGRILVDVLDRDESTTFLRSRMPGLAETMADALAAELGDLPLALAQAAAYLEQTAIDPAEYLEQFSRRRSAFLARGEVLGYEGRLDSAWDLSLQRLAATRPESLRLLEHSAFLAPEPIPLDLFATRHDLLTGQRDDGRADPQDVVERAVGGAAGLSLIRRNSASFQMHRLVQAVIRGHLPARDRDRVEAQAAQLVADAHPGDPTDPASWPAYRRLVPHVFALGAAADRLPEVRRMLLDTVVYLNGTAPPRWSGHLARRVLDRWAPGLGDDHPDTLAMAAFVMQSWIWAGEAGAARDLGRRCLPRARATLGPDDPLTLRLGGYLAVAQAWQAEVAESRALALDTIDRARSTFPADHPDLLRLATYITLALGWIGDPAATDLAERAYAAATEVFGPNHPSTLLAANEVIFGLLTAGDTAAIRTLGEDVLARSRQVFGDHHHVTVGSASLLALGLVWDGDVDRAIEIGEQFLSGSGAGLGADHLITLTVAAATATIRAAAPDPPGSAQVPELATALHMPGPDHPITLALAGASARLAERTGDRDGASRAAATAERAGQLLGFGHPLVRLFPPARPTRPDTRAELPSPAASPGNGLAWDRYSRSACRASG